MFILVVMKRSRSLLESMIWKICL